MLVSYFFLPWRHEIVPLFFHPLSLYTVRRRFKEKSLRLICSLSKNVLCCLFTTAWQERHLRSVKYPPPRVGFKDFSWCKTRVKPVDMHYISQILPVLYKTVIYNPLLLDSQVWCMRFRTHERMYVCMRHSSFIIQQLTYSTIVQYIQFETGTKGEASGHWLFYCTAQAVWTIWEALVRVQYCTAYAAV